MNKYNKRNKYSLGGLKTPRRGEHSGSLTPFAPNLYNINGSSHANGGVNIDKGNLKVEAEGGEVVWDKNDGYAIFSNQPILGGQSPANLVRRGANPNEVFKAQQISNMINHRGDFKNMKYGGDKKKSYVRTLWEDMLEASRPIHNPTLSLPFTGKGQIGSRIIGGSLKGMKPNSSIVYKGKDKKGTYYNVGQLHPFTINAINLSTLSGREKWQKIQGQKGGDAVRKALNDALPYVGALQEGMIGGPVALAGATIGNMAMDSDLPMGVKLPIVIGSSFLDNKGIHKGTRGFGRLSNIRGLNANPGILPGKMNIVPPINKGLATKNILNKMSMYINGYPSVAKGRIPFSRFIDTPSDGQLSFNFDNPITKNVKPASIVNEYDLLTERGIKNQRAKNQFKVDYNNVNMGNGTFVRVPIKQIKERPWRYTPEEYEKLGRLEYERAAGNVKKPEDFSYDISRSNSQIVPFDPLNQFGIIRDDAGLVNYKGRGEIIRSAEPNLILKPFYDAKKFRSARGRKDIIRTQLSAEEQANRYYREHPREYHPLFNPEPLNPNNLPIKYSFNPSADEVIGLVKGLDDLGTYINAAEKANRINYIKTAREMINERGQSSPFMQGPFPEKLNQVSVEKLAARKIEPKPKTNIVRSTFQGINKGRKAASDWYKHRKWTPFNYYGTKNWKGRAARMIRDAAWIGIPTAAGNLIIDADKSREGEDRIYDMLGNYKYGGRIKAKCGSRVKAEKGFPPIDYNEFKNLSIDDVVDMVNEENNAPGNIKYEGKIKPMNIILPDEETKKELSSTDTFHTLTPRFQNLSSLRDINTLGNLAGSVITRIYDDRHIKKMKYPKYSVPYVAYKRPTNVNNNADLAILNNTYRTSANNAFKNTASSKTLRNTLNDVSENIGLNKIKSYQDKYNTERGLISTDIANRENIANKNIDKFNSDRQNIIDFVNQKNQMRWQSRTNFINNIREIGKDYISSKEADKKFKKDLYVSLLSNAISNGGEPTFFNAMDVLDKKLKNRNFLRWLYD